MSRISKCFEQIKAANKKALVTYIVCGDPYPSATLDVMHELVAKGVDIIELGVPFSDPMAEGPVIQHAHERALKHNVSLRDTLAVVKAFRETNQQTPVVLMGYANPVECFGYAAFADAASAAGIDGLLTVDLPPEEVGELKAELDRVGIDNIFLLAPTTKAERGREIARLASGFLYYVSLKGVTGAGHLDVGAVKDKLAEFGINDLPVCVGFGIKDANTAKQIAQHADGVVVGSALVARMGADAAASSDAIASDLGVLIGEIRQALDELC